MSSADLSLILRSVQACVGEFPTVELGAMQERTYHLRKWRYALSQALEATGPIVEEWWRWCWTAAEEVHEKYLVTPIMIRESVGYVNGYRENGVILKRGSSHGWLPRCQTF